VVRLFRKNFINSLIRVFDVIKVCSTWRPVYSGLLVGNMPPNEQ